MPTGHTKSKRVLEPIERISEVLFGLIMVLTFTGALSAAESGRTEVRTMLIAAIGCNLAWGLIDAIMYLMGSLAQRAEDLRTVSAIRNAVTDEEVRHTLARVLPAVVASALSPADLQGLRETLSRSLRSDERIVLKKEDWLGAAAVFILVFASTFPVVLPFMTFQEIAVALRVSNAIAVALLMVAGYAFGQIAGYRPWLTAGAMVVLGCILVALTIALGG